MPRYHVARRLRAGHFSDQPGFTLVEMLIAVAITLVMMAAVVTLFANITQSVRDRRATMEMSGQLRHLRNVLQQDLAGHTCPGVTWQRPESDHGYMEFIEGQYRDLNPSMLTDGDPNSDRNGNPDIDGDGQGGKDELDPALSTIPPSNGGTLTGVNGLGDYDDILMFTTRNEHEPFVGRVPDYTPGGKGFTSFESPLAEVIWFAMENPQQEERARGFFGEPGMRTIYRRALLIAPWVDPYGALNAAQSRPGVVGLLNAATYTRTEVDKALAVLTAFQDQFDLSVRLEWDALANGGTGQWKIVANTLADLTKRENRFGHYQYHPSGDRRYPYSIVSAGTYTTSNETVKFVVAPDLQPPTGTAGTLPKANLIPDALNQRHVASFTVLANNYDSTARKYAVRPFVYVDTTSATVDGTANAMLNDDGQVVRIVSGPVPLWGGRRGQDIMMSDVLAFDLRVYDPGAPIYQSTNAGAVIDPCDPAWKTYYNATVGSVTSTAADPATFVGQGAYVDMGYAFGAASMPMVAPGAPWIMPWFAEPHGIANVPTNRLLTPGYALYDTWSTSYENNGIDDDGDGVIDQGTDGLDSIGHYLTVGGPAGPTMAPDVRLGPDDAGERETAPPYDKPLRGLQVVVRVYERDSRQIRQVRIDQHFLTE